LPCWVDCAECTDGEDIEEGGAEERGKLGTRVKTVGNTKGLPTDVLSGVISVSNGLSKELLMMVK
jgi:hypothetical protein